MNEIQIHTMFLDSIGHSVSVTQFLTLSMGTKDTIQNKTSQMMTEIPSTGFTKRSSMFGVISNNSMNTFQSRCRLQIRSRK